mgnify:CR=1 FL=1
MLPKICKEGNGMREREIEEKFRIAVRQAGGKAYKFMSPGNDGVPEVNPEAAFKHNGIIANPN